MTAPNLRGSMKFLLLFVGTVLLISDYAECAQQNSRAEQLAIAQDNEKNGDILIPKEGTEADPGAAAAAAKRRSLARKRRQYSYQAAISAQNSAQSSNSQSSSYFAQQGPPYGSPYGSKKRNIFDPPLYPSIYDDFDEGDEADDPYNYEFRKKKKRGNRRRGNKKRRG